MNKTNLPPKPPGTENLIVSHEHVVAFEERALNDIFSTNLEPEGFYLEKILEAERANISLEDHLVFSLDVPNKKPIYLDSTNTYKYNSLGYRSPEFGNTKLLYAGCSTTFGTGVPEERIWGSVVANTLGLSYANLSKQGASSSWIVKNIMAYFDTYGHPEILCCLFPDLYRMRIATNELQLIDRVEGVNNPSLAERSYSKVKNIHLGRVLSPKKSPTYSKKPHVAEDVFPIDMAIYDSIRSILFLDQYCRANGITFVWSTWEISALDLLSNIKELYPKNYSNFIDSGMRNWRENPKSNPYGRIYTGVPSQLGQPIDIACHRELLLEYGENFYHGMDILHGVEGSHPSIHEHTHIAEAFINFLKNKLNL